MKKFPALLKRKIDEINEMLPKTKDANEEPGGYFGSTHYSYVRLEKPIEIKGNYVYIHGVPGRYNMSFEKRYNINKINDEIDGLSSLRYDLNNIASAFRKSIKSIDSFSSGGGINSNSEITKMAPGGNVGSKKIKWKPSRNEKVEGYVSKSFPHGAKGDLRLSKAEFIKKWSERIESWISVKPNLNKVENFFPDFSMDFIFEGSDGNLYRIYSPGESAKSKEYHIQKFKSDAQMAKGGLAPHGLKVGDKIKDDMFWEDSIVVENDKFKIRAKVDLNTGKRTEIAYELGGCVNPKKMVTGGNVQNYLIGTTFKFRNEFHRIKKIEKSKDSHIITTTENKTFNYNILKDNGVQFAEKAEPVKSIKIINPDYPKTPRLITKQEYKSILRNAMKDAGSMGDEEFTHDMAQSMFLNKDIQMRLHKDYPYYNAKELREQLQYDLESYIK